MPQLDVIAVVQAFHQQASAVDGIFYVDLKLLQVQMRNNGSADNK